MNEYVKVCSDETTTVTVEGDGVEGKKTTTISTPPIELPVEDDKTLLLSTVVAQFPGATGLKYKVDQAFRGVRLVEGKFYPPEGGWGDVTYSCVFPPRAFDVEKKRKCEEDGSCCMTKVKRFEIPCCDLIVLGLPWSVDDNQLKQYFQTFGQIVMSVVKKDPITGNSKGFGFIRFQEYESQIKVLGKRHLIEGRWCEVKYPSSKEGSSYHQRVPCKIFVGRLTEDITLEDLRTHFTQFGTVTDVYIPKPFRSFAFVAFENPLIAQSLCGQNQQLKGTLIHISEASPRGR